MISSARGRVIAALVAGWAMVATAGRAEEATEAAPLEFEWTFTVSGERADRMGLPGSVDAWAGTVWVACPAGFDPAERWPIVLISATGDAGLNSGVAWAKRYAEAGRAAGWVVVGADAAVAVRPETAEFRHGLAAAALDELARRWPGAETWPLALGGFSGGAKYAGYLGAQFARDGRRPAGLFLAGCNEAAPVIAGHRYNPPGWAWRRVPVYLSSGDEDPVATPRDHEQVRRKLSNDGFRHVRLATYHGGHGPHPPHLTEALRWFAEAGPD